MSHEHIATYLNDHLAGSVVALELLENLEEMHDGTPAGQVLAEVRADVTADQQELKALMVRLDVSESRIRKSTAWLAGRAAELKLRVDDPADGALRRLEALEILELGIGGKRALWRALAVAAEAEPALRLADYDHMARRAEDQRARVEQLRLEAARAALAGIGQFAADTGRRSPLQSK